MLLIALPTKIRERVILNARKQLRGRFDYESDRATLSGAITWNSTPEGHSFWARIEQGKFHEYYEKYPEDIEPTEEELKKKEEDLYKFLNS